jgi:hypothetical protein
MTRHHSPRVRAGLAAVALLASGRVAYAAGPQYVNFDGRPFVWSSTGPVPYTLDLGPFGRFSNAQATAWVAEAFQSWMSVDGVVSLTLQATSPSSVDITGDNILDVLDALPDDVNLIILDSDGSVLDTLFGYGDGDAAGGRGGARAFDFRTGAIVQGWVFLNGRNSGGSSADWWRGLVQHEVGHFLGLAHSQLNPQVTFNGDPTDDALAPRMSYNDGPNSRPSLHVEDRAWIAALYPKAGAAPATGSVRGRVLLPDGKTGLQGIQVVARRDGDEEATAVSGASGYLYKDPYGYGSRSVELQGFYELPGLPPGNYRIAIEAFGDGAEVAPRHAFLPGGRRFYRAGGPLATRREDATLLTVTAGQVLEGKDFVLDGPVRSLNRVGELEENGSPEMAQGLRLPAVVTGRASKSEFKVWEFPLPGRRKDKVEDWYRFVLTEPTTISAVLTASNAAADLHLYLLSDPRGGSVPFPSLVREMSAEAGTPPETIQVRLEPGVYFLGVSSADSSANADSDYQLTVIDTPSPDLAAPASNPPRITLATLSNVAPGGLRVRWQTDQDANGVLYVRSPERELGSPLFTRDHSVEVTGLSAGTYYYLELFSRNAGGEMDSLPRLLVNTAFASSGRTPFMSAGLWSAVPQDEKNRTFLLVAHVSNYGDGPASNVKIERLTLPSGWRFDAQLALPLDLGQIGRGAFAVVAARVTRTADNAAPLDLILQGSYANIDGAVRAFGG